MNYVFVTGFRTISMPLLVTKHILPFLQQLSWFFLLLFEETSSFSESSDIYNLREIGLLVRKSIE